jgi:hypothetical protein
MRFQNGLENKPRVLKLKGREYITAVDLLKRLNERDEKNFYIVVDSIMCTKFKTDMTVLFNKIQNHLIEIRMKEIREMSLRKFYKGRYSIDSFGNFNIRLRKFICDKVEADNIEWKKYIKML